MVTRSPAELRLYCPWPERVNPHFDPEDVDTAAADWYRSVAASPVLNDGQLKAGDLSCRLFPDTANRDALVLSTQHILFGVMYDDHITSAVESDDHLRDCLAGADRIFDTLGTPAREDCPHLTAFRDLAEGWSAVTSDVQWYVFAASWRAYLTTVIPGRAIGTVDSYLRWRHADYGCDVFSALLPVLNGFTPDRADWDDPRLIAIRHAAGLITGIDNDLVSPGAEQTRAQIVDLMPHQRAAIVALRDLFTCRLERLVASLGANQPWGRSTAYFVPANLGWFRQSLRYRQRPGRSFVVPETTQEHPDHDCDTAPPYPAVSWWWQL